MILSKSIHLSPKGSIVVSKEKTMGPGCMELLQNSVMMSRMVSLT